MSQSRQAVINNIRTNMSRIRRLVFSSLPHSTFGKDMPTPAQMGVLMLLENNTGAALGAKDIAEYLHISAPAATQLLNGLIKKKLLHRVIDKDDSRKIKLLITATGAKQLDIIKKIHNTLFKKAFAPLSLKELQALDVLQKKVIKNFHA